MLGVQHVLHLCVTHVTRGVQRPVRERNEGGQRLGSVGVDMRITESGEDLVHGVPGHARKGAAGHRVVERLAPVRECADESIAARALARSQLRHDVRRALGKAHIIRRRVLHRDRGEIVAQRMSVAPDVHPGLLRLPAAIHGRLRQQSGIHMEVVQETIRVEREEIRRVRVPARHGMVRQGAGHRARRTASPRMPRSPRRRAHARGVRPPRLRRRVTRGVRGATGGALLARPIRRWSSSGIEREGARL